MLRSGEDASNKANALMAWLAEGFKAALDDGYVSKVRCSHVPGFNASDLLLISDIPPPCSSSWACQAIPSAAASLKR